MSSAAVVIGALRINNLLSVLYILGLLEMTFEGKQNLISSNYMSHMTPRGGGGGVAGWGWGKRRRRALTM